MSISRLVHVRSHCDQCLWLVMRMCMSCRNYARDVQNRRINAFLVLSVIALARTQAATTIQKRAVPAGFVTTNGQEFELDGEPFYFVGANSFWLPLLITEEDVDTTFQTMANAGVKALRTWGFNAINATELPYALSSGLTYYQIWNNSEWTLNEGPQGLQRLDYVIATATKYDIRIILTFANNWYVLILRDKERKSPSTSYPGLGMV
ncbi:hypothetical protein AcW1_000761 [Taiwanofungus camphoratus]|nr:hypothetical protein AcW1_000761 [Antrodia cinnamomea]